MSVKRARDRRRLNRLAALGCIVCRNEGYGITPADMTAIHHLRNGVGMGQRSGDDRAIPLCAKHHQTGGHGVAIHAGRREWERRFGDETTLLKQVEELLHG